MSMISAITPTSASIPIVIEKVDTSSAAMQGNKVKSIVVAGDSSHSFSIVKKIVRFVKNIFRVIYFFFFPIQRINTDQKVQPPLSPDSQNDVASIEKSKMQSDPVPQKLDTSTTIDIEASSTPKEQAETPIEQQNSPNLALSNSDKLLTASNLVQWGLVGAAALGVAPAITGALGLAASVGSGIATYCMLPEDASLIRKAMTLPMIGKKIVEFNPIISGIVQATSLYNLVTGSVSKLSQAWDGLKTNPKEALQAGAVHLFNLASGAAFAAESAGLINLRPDPVLPDKPCDSETDMESAWPKTETGPGSISSKKSIKLATVYDNKDKNGQIDIERQKISDIVVQNHRNYASKWDLDHDVVSDNLVAGQCIDPSTGTAANCSPYMNKIQYFRMQCEDPAQQGKLVIYGDDDLVYTNMEIDPLDAFNRLRNGKDTSVVMMREGGDWAKYFKLPGYSSTDPRVSVNSGFIMGRIDKPFCKLIERTWEHRNTLMDQGPNFKDCPTVAFCKTHGITSLGDQTAMALALQENLNVIDRTVTIVLPRDLSAPHRAHIAFNTLNRDGCHQELVNGKLSDPLNIEDYDKNTYPDGIWRKGDWNGQTAGYRVMGVPGRITENGRCEADPTQSLQTLQNMRLLKIREMLPPKIERDITFAVAHTRDGNSDESQYGHLTLENHEAYAARHGAKFYHETDKSMIKGQCAHPLFKNADGTPQVEDCSPYMMKVQAIRNWLSKPDTSGKEEWLCIADDDGVYGNMRINPSHVIDNMRGSSDASILIVEEPQKGVTPINTGLLFVRRDAHSRQFVEKWWNERNTATKAPHDPNCHSHGSCENQVHSVNDQSCFTIALQKNPEFLSKEIVKIAPLRSPDRLYGINTFFRKGCFYRIQAKWEQPTKKIDYGQDDLETGTNCEALSGDFYFQAAGVPREGRYCRESIGVRHPIRKKYVQRMLQMVIPN